MKGYEKRPSRYDEPVDSAELNARANRVISLIWIGTITTIVAIALIGYLERLQ